MQKALRESALPHVRERILILLLQNDGKTQRGIADFLGCLPRTAAYWCMHGDPNKLESLQNRRNQESHRIQSGGKPSLKWLVYEWSNCTTFTV